MDRPILADMDIRFSRSTNLFVCVLAAVGAMTIPATVPSASASGDVTKAKITCAYTGRITFSEAETAAAHAISFTSERTFATDPKKCHGDPIKGVLLLPSRSTATCTLTGSCDGPATSMTPIA